MSGCEVGLTSGPQIGNGGPCTKSSRGCGWRRSNGPQIGNEGPWLVGTRWNMWAWRRRPMTSRPVGSRKDSWEKLVRTVRRATAASVALAALTQLIVRRDGTGAAEKQPSVGAARRESRDGW